MKKGIVSLWLSVLVSLSLILLMVLFYFLFLHGSREPEEIAALESSGIAAQNVLANLLDSEVVVDGKPVLFSDLVRLWHGKRVPDKALSGSALDFLDRVYAAAAGEEAMPAFRTVLKTPEKTKLVFWLSIQEKPRLEKEPVPVFIMGPFGPDVSYPADCLRLKTCPDAAGAFVPVSEERAVYVALWQVAA
jgi:hypothetical protein